MPPLKFSDFSGFSGSAPSAIAIGEPTGKVPTSTSPTPVRLTVEVVEKNCCAMPGARKPVDTDPRSASPSIGSKRRSEEHTSELQSLIRNSYAVFCLKKKKIHNNRRNRRVKNRDKTPTLTTRLKPYRA